jgi:hypothetical protein
MLVNIMKNMNVIKKNYFYKYANLFGVKDTKKVFAKISGKDVNKFTEKSIQTLIKME